MVKAANIIFTLWQKPEVNSSNYLMLFQLPLMVQEMLGEELPLYPNLFITKLIELGCPDLDSPSMDTEK